jgi:hypothetical protein
MQRLRWRCSRQTQPLCRSAIPRPPPQATSPSRSSPRGRSPELYKQLVAGLVLATAKEVFAVAPAITEIRIVALRGTPADPYGKIHPVSMLAAQIPRAALNGVQWTKVDALSIVDKISSELLTRTAGPSKAFAPPDLKTAPEIARLIQVITSRS